jgi:hypothetical protein
MSNNEPLATYRLAGITITAYANRLEIQNPGPKLIAKSETILYRNIASIEKPPMLNALDIKTNDGKKHRISLPPAKLAELKSIIESHL